MKNFEWDIVSQNISIISAEKFFSPDTHRQTPLDGLSVRKVSGMQGQESLQLCVCILRVLRHVALIFVNFATWAYLWKYSHGAKLTQHQSLRFTLHQVCISSQISWIWRRCDKRWNFANTRESVKQCSMDSFENGEGGGVAYSNLKKVLLKRQLLLSSLSVSPSPVCSLSLPPSPPITLQLQQNAFSLKNFSSVHLNSSYRVFILTVPPKF